MTIEDCLSTLRNDYCDEAVWERFNASSLVAVECLWLPSLGLFLSKTVRFHEQMFRNRDLCLFSVYPLCVSQRGLNCVPLLIKKNRRPVFSAKAIWTSTLLFFSPLGVHCDALAPSASNSHLNTGLKRTDVNPQATSQYNVPNYHWPYQCY